MATEKSRQWRLRARPVGMVKESDFELAVVPVPEPGPGEVLVDVKASSINFPDALMVQGLYQVKPPLPFTPGAELAGVVKEAGEGVAGFAAGDRVVGFCRLGGFAEEALAAADQLTPLPPGMDFDVAAAFGLTYGTSLHALQECARLQAGDTLLVLGAGGGVGSAAVELGKLMGARVIAAASSEEKLALCRRLGADETIDYGRDDLRERLKAIAGERGVDAVYDPVGGPYSEPALRATGWGGRFLVVGFASGEVPKVALNLALLKVHGVHVAVRKLQCPVDVKDDGDTVRVASGEPMFGTVRLRLDPADRDKLQAML